MSLPTKLILLILAILFLLGSTYLAVVVVIPRMQASQSTADAAIASAQSQTQVVQNNARFVTLTAVMIAGIVASYIFEAAKKSGPTVNVPAELGKMLTSSRFIMAIVVSPLIFNSIYLAIGLNPQNIGDYLLAFQNGFFWETVMYGLSRGT